MAGEQHLYLVASGAYAPATTVLANEIWQFGIRLLCVPGGDPDPIGPLAASWTVVPTNINRNETNWTIEGNWSLEGGVSDFNGDDYLNDQAGPAMAAFIAAAGTQLSTVVQLHELRLYPIVGPSGHVEPAPPYLQGSPITLRWKTPVAGSQGGAMMPPQCSTVVSLRTSQTGRRGRGRFFLPPMTAAAVTTGATNGTLQAAAQASCATAAKTLLEALQYDGVNPLYGPHVRAIVTGSPYNAYAGVSSVRIGNVIDTQQRRRRSLPETYAVQSVEW